MDNMAYTSRLDFPPLSIHRFSQEAFTAGVEVHKIDRVSAKIYGIEKTLADCFKLRHIIGMDIFLEALKLYKSRKKVKVNKLIDFAKICNVEKVMRPYIEMVA
jgi:hypothetical protein